MIEDILTRDVARIREDESTEDYSKRCDLMNQQYREARRIHGNLYMVFYGEYQTGMMEVNGKEYPTMKRDIRPMWEDQILVSQLKNEIKTEINTTYDCPLCQPYDSWEGISKMEENRRFLTKIVIPKYDGGAIDEEGVFIKCPCSASEKKKQYLKFKMEIKKQGRR